MIAADSGTSVAPRRWSIALRTAPAVVLLAALGVAACGPGSVDEQLREALEAEGIAPLDYGTSPDPQRVALGRALFYDKVLAGNRDIACSTCHDPASRTGDGLSLSIGTGGTGIGSDRTLGPGRRLLQRNAPELFSRGVEDWQVAQWDGHVQRGEPWPLPDGVDMPDAIEGDLLAAHVLFHIADRDAMRGVPGDFDVDGEENTLAYWPDDELPAMWDELIVRLLAIPEYVDLFADAFPDVDRDDLGFEHAALAIAAYEVDAFSLSESPWDLYVAGDEHAIVEPAKRGALLFWGKARCNDCHGGALLSDQQFHNICTPQLGITDDWGRGARTRDEADRYAFRTPPLRNVSFTSPYMHAGSHTTLEDALRHHLNACAKLRTFDGEDLPSRFRELLLGDSELLDAIEATAEPMARERMDLGHQEISDLMQFLEALTDPDVVYMADLTPDSVPSGLPVDR
jgi:cytochrome c peroxidase